MAAGAAGINVAMSALDKGLLSALDSLMVKFAGIEGAANLAGKAIEIVSSAVEKLYEALSEASKFAAIQERSLVQLGAALKATGKDAQITVSEVAEFASELQKVTKFGDEMTIEASKWFAQMPRLDPANMKDYMAAAQDLAEVMGVDLRIASQVLSRALEDPRRASRALRRANIMLSTQQRRLIEDLDEAGMVAEAQAVIMDGVKTSVGGAAIAMASTLEGMRSQIRGIAADIKEHIGAIPNQFLTPVVEAIKEQAEAWSDYFNTIVEGTRKGKKALKEFLDKTEDIRDVPIEVLAKKFEESYTTAEVAGMGFARIMSGISESLREGLQTENAFLSLITDPLRGVAEATLLPMYARHIHDFGESIVETKGKADALKTVFEEINRLLEAEKAAAEAAEAERLVPILARLKRESDADQKMRDAAEAWLTRYERKSLTVAERAIEDYEKLLEIHESIGVADERLLTITKALKKEWEESFGFAKKREEIQKDILTQEASIVRKREQLLKLQDRIEKEHEKRRGFRAAITSLTGLYDRMQAGAASIAVEDKTIQELERQREVLQKQIDEELISRDKQLEALDGVTKAIISLGVEGVARFGV